MAARGADWRAVILEYVRNYFHWRGGLVKYFMEKKQNFHEMGPPMNNNYV